MLYNFLLEIHYQNEQSNSFAKFSQNNPEVEILLWCDANSDILELRGDKEAINEAISDLKKDLGEVTSLYSWEGHVQLVLELCECSKFPLDSIFGKYDCLELPPIKYLAGREIINLLVTPDDTGLILEDIRRVILNAYVKVLKLAPLKSFKNPYPFYLPLDDLKECLTEKQQKALTLAYRNGYYGKNRPKALTATLAEKMNIGRRTYADHLQKAEQKIMSFLVPSLMED
ncbi:MAG: helix-turn-helix domain-containing protein [Candidatus Hodarchaeota archaeon]